MKRFLLALALMLCFSFCACAETLEFMGMTFDSAATVIDFGDMAVTDIDGLRALIDQMPDLAQVDMYASVLSTAEMDVLFDGYPQIFFGWTLNMKGHIVRTDATSFSTLHGRCPNHYTEDFYPLRYCRNLVALDLGHNYIDDISFLRNFPGMKVLILACNNIRDISVLAELTELEYLELFSNKIKDFTPLLALENLKDLNISNNPVSDITPLFGMTQLERFWSGMNRSVRSQVKEMEKLLPECEIFWDGEPTWGGWREHHRYDTIYAIFNEGVYRPFDEEGQ